MNRMLGGEEPGIEGSLTSAIRRASGDNDQLVPLVQQVTALVETAKATRDRSLMDSVDRLLVELQAAAAGIRTVRPVLIYKDCAMALQPSRRSWRKAVSGKMAVQGYGSTFGGEPDSYGDIIAPYAFSESLAQHRKAGTMPKMFWSHDAQQLAGKWESMSEDSHGLLAKGVLADTTLGRDLNALIELGALDSLSIGFTIAAGGATSFDSRGIRTITKIDLHELSLVSMPANGNARLNSAPVVSDLDRAIAAVAEEIEKEDSNVIEFPAKDLSADDEADLVVAIQRLNRTIRRG